MDTEEKERDEEGTSDAQAQQDLTKSVGTRLERPEKPAKRKLFGRREKPAAKS
jgi:hypothetical protein